mgnify:FL=1
METNLTAAQDEAAKAGKSLEVGDVEKAIQHYHKAQKLAPSDADIICNLGIAYFRNQEFGLAEESFKKALSLDNTLTEANFNLGLLFQEKEEWESALSFYKEAFLNNKKDLAILLRMGECAGHANREDDAYAFWEEAVKHHPDDLEAVSLFAGLLIEREEYEKAEDVLRMGLVSNNKEVSLYFTLGLVLNEQNKMNKALAQFKKVIDIDPQHALAYYNLAACCEVLNFDKQAEPFYAKAYKLNPDFPDPVFQLAELYVRRNMKKKAVTMYEKFVAMVEESGEQIHPEYRKQFIRACEYLSGWFKGHGDNVQAQNYADKKDAAPEDPDPQARESGEDDYRVSLQIEE